MAYTDLPPGSFLVTIPISTANEYVIAASTSSVTLLAANTARRGVVIRNPSTTATLYFRYGATATIANATYSLPPGALYEMPSGALWGGVISGIWDAADGSSTTVTELL